jgi:PIN domain nuclease of toxin-antitoxin system
MRLLLDTHLLLWTTIVSSRLTARARQLIDDGENELLFSVASIWEIAVKRLARSADFDVDARTLRNTLLAANYVELPVTSDHAIATLDLPPLHKDPVDRILIAQSLVEGITLLTSDRAVSRYPGPIERV